MKESFDKLKIGNKSFNSRLMLGTGKYKTTNDAIQSIISPEEVEGMHPLLNMDNIVGISIFGDNPYKNDNIFLTPIFLNSLILNHPI